MERVYRGQKRTPPRAQFSASAPPKVKMQRRMRSRSLWTPVRRSAGGKRLFLMDSSASLRSRPYTVPRTARCCSPSQLKSLTELEKELFPNEPCLFEEESVKVDDTSAQVHKEKTSEACLLRGSVEPAFLEHSIAGGDEMNFRELCHINSPLRFSKESNHA